MNTRTLDLDAKILYIEDSQSIAGATLSLFKGSKANIQHVNCVKDMRQAFTESKFDLVITDYYLKNNETGNDVISFIRQSDDIDKVEPPILVVSAESDPKNVLHFSATGQMILSSNLMIMMNYLFGRPT